MTEKQQETQETSQPDSELNEVKNKVFLAGIKCGVGFSLITTSILLSTGEGSITTTPFEAILAIVGIGLVSPLIMDIYFYHEL